MKTGAITPALPPRTSRAHHARASESEKAAPVLELHVEIRSREGDRGNAPAKGAPSQNETAAHETLAPQNAATFVAQVIGQFLEAAARGNVAPAYARVRNLRTSYLYDRRF
jgi:hypothetical protein